MVQNYDLCLLVQQAKSGDQSSIAELYRISYKDVYLSIKSIIREEDTVLDLTQDSFVKAFTSLDKLGDPSRFCAWVKAIGRNAALDFQRKNKPLLFSEMMTEDGAEIDLPFEDLSLANSPELALDAWETRRLLKEILDSLSDSQRMAVSLFYYEGFSVKDIARIAGMSENSVKVHLYNGRKRIGDKVKELENQGIKLYGMAPVVFLVWLFRRIYGIFDQFFPAPAAPLYQTVLPRTMQGRVPATSPGSQMIPPKDSGVSRTAKALRTAGKVRSGISKVKLTAWILGGVAAAAACTIGGIAAARHYELSENTPVSAPQVTEESLAPDTDPDEKDRPELPPQKAEKQAEVSHDESSELSTELSSDPPAAPPASEMVWIVDGETRTMQKYDGGEFSFALPHLLLPGNDGALAEQELKDILDAETDGFINHCFYEWYQMDDTLTLIFSTHHYYMGNFDTFYVYNFDIATGKRLSNDEFLQCMNVSPAEVDAAVKAVMMDGFIANDNPKYSGGSEEEAIAAYEALLEEKDFSDAVTGVCPTGIAAIVDVAIPAGSGHVTLYAPILSRTEEGFAPVN